MLHTGLLSNLNSVYSYQLLSPIKYPLAGKYYQAQGSKSRVPSNNIVAVVKHCGEIIGAARLAPIDEYWFLTGVHTNENHRSRGIANTLISILTDQREIIYSFPYQHLVTFYQRLGFELVTPESLPCELAQRFNAYVKQGREIVVMIRKNKQ